MRTISREKFNELNDYLNYDGVDEDFFTKLHDTTGITAKPYTSYSFYDENGDYVGNLSEDLRDILNHAGIDIRKE